MLIFLETLHFAEKIFLWKNFSQLWKVVELTWSPLQLIADIAAYYKWDLEMFIPVTVDISMWTVALTREKKSLIIPFSPHDLIPSVMRYWKYAIILKAGLQTWNKRPFQEVIINVSKERGQILASSLLESPAGQQHAGEGLLVLSSGFSSPWPLVDAEELGVRGQSFTEVVPAGCGEQRVKQSKGSWLKHRHGVCNVLQALIKNLRKNILLSPPCSHPSPPPMPKRLIV